MHKDSQDRGCVGGTVSRILTDSRTQPIVCLVLRNDMFSFSITRICGVDLKMHLVNLF